MNPIQTKGEQACKPGSVPAPLAGKRAGSHLSGACSCLQPQAAYPGISGPPHLPLFGLAPGGVYLGSQVSRTRRPPFPGQPVAWLLVGSYPAVAPLPRRITPPKAVYISVALSLGSPPLGVTQHLALWSPDFPPLPGNSKIPGEERLPGLLPLYGTRGQLRSSTSRRWRGLPACPLAHSSPAQYGEPRPSATSP